MANKKSTSAKSAPQKSILNKIAGQIGHLAGEIVVEKDHLIEMAGNAIDSVKETIHGITTKKKNLPKKVIKAIVKKAVSKTGNSPTKKVAKSIASRKTVPAKKAIKKVAKKASRKK